MSLKAKLEAVIYAAEEPVTLAQMSVLFAEEALAWRVEHDSRQAAAELELVPEAIEPEEAPDLIAGDEPVVENRELQPESVSDPEQEAKRLARQREREVRDILREILDELLAEYSSADRGIEMREIAGGYRMATKPECHDAVRSFVKSLKPPLKLSLPALETLAVIAYKQPVTAPEVGEIRGVDSAGVLGSLMSRKLIATAGRKPVVGRPMLYKTTREFLLRFGLKDISELPSMEEFEKLAAVELSEGDDFESSGEGDSVPASGELFSEEDASPHPDSPSSNDASSTTATGEATSPADPPQPAAEAQASTDPMEHSDDSDVLEIEAKV